MQLISNQFKNGALLDKSYQSDMDNASPQLSWSNPPANTASFAIAMHDPDAPTGGAGWWHWLAVNIPSTISELAKNAGEASGKSMPAGSIQLYNDAGTLGYSGCMPPVGDPPHRYIFTIYALDADMPQVDASMRTSMVGFLVNAHCLAKASISGLYARSE